MEKISRGSLSLFLQNAFKINSRFFTFVNREPSTDKRYFIKSIQKYRQKNFCYLSFQKYTRKY